MRLSFASGILCAGLFVVSCVQRDYNTTETKAFKDTKTTVKNPDGTFTVTCDWGAVEENVPAEKINDVCKPVPTPTPTPTPPPNKLPFNAFEMWRTGQGSAVLDYPQGYEITSGSTSPDGVFYENYEVYWANFTPIGVPTAGAFVSGALLTYPAQGERTLKLKFSPESPGVMIHSEAVQYCREKGLRLPTVRELLDFCAAGYARHVYDGRYSTHRCGENGLWSASVRSSSRASAWQFSGGFGNVEYYWRYNTRGVRCVGGL